RARAGDDTGPGCLPKRYEKLRFIVSWTAHQCSLWRQGDRHQPHSADEKSGTLYRRPVGWEVHEDLHLSETTDRRVQRDDRRILLAAVRARRLSRSCLTGQHPPAPLPPPHTTHTPGTSMM